MRKPSPIVTMPAGAAVPVRPLPWPAATLVIALLSLLSWYGLALGIATLLRG